MLHQMNGPRLSTNRWTLLFVLALSLPVYAQGGPAPNDAGTGAASSLVTNPNFQLATKDATWPDDWIKGAGLSWETEDGKHFLRLTASEPGKMIMAYREVAIPEGVKSLQITVTYRSSGVVRGEQNFMDARAIFHFLDANRKPLKGDPKVIDMTTNGGSDWNTASEKSAVPLDAAYLVVMPCLFKVAAGTLDLAEVSVTPVNP
jgi:hypothetical protein